MGLSAAAPKAQNRLTFSERGIRLVKTSYVGRFVLSVGAAAALLAGCGGAQTGPAALAGSAREPASHGAAKYIYVANEIRTNSKWTSSVNIYSTLVDGNVPPLTVIGGSQTQLTQVNGIVVNASGEIYVVDTDTNQIVGFAAGSSGNAAPNVVIGGSNTNLSWPIGLAQDAVGNLYVANCGSDCNGGSLPPCVLEFAAGSNGDVAPMKNISGSETQLSHANAVALDASGNIYVSNISGGNSIDVFAPSANGNVAPSRVISGSQTLLDGPLGLAVDQHGIYTDSDYGSYLERFGLTANGNVPPEAAISGGNTRLSGPDGIAVDSVGTLYATSRQRILAYPARAHGNVHPSVKIKGADTQLNAPVFLYVQ
jgi:hypothetical protein